MTLDLHRQLIEQSLCCFESYKNGQTSFIHFYRHAPYGLKHDTIPLLHNFLYVLALLKSSNVSLMQEGFRLLNHLLHFQIEGKFPFYLHDYPFVRVSADELDCLITLDRISAFSQVMDKSLCQKLHHAMTLLKEVVFKEKWVNPLDEWRKNQFFSIPGEEYEPKSSRELSSLIPFSFPVEKYFCYETKTYSGPLIEEMWQGSGPERTLFHDYMAISVEGKVPSTIAPCQMFYPLIKEFAKSTEGKKAFEVTSLERSENRFLAVFEKVFFACERTFHLTCYMQHFHFKREGGELVFTLTKPFDPHDAKDPQIVFYLSHPEFAKVFVEGERALVFYEGEKVVIQVGEKKLMLQFRYDKEEIDAVGIILRGNRPTQLIIDKFSAYDLLIGLRMPRWREGACIRVLCTDMQAVGN